MIAAARWAGALSTVLALYAGTALLLLRRDMPVPAEVQPQAPVLLELAPAEPVPPTPTPPPPLPPIDPPLVAKTEVKLPPRPKPRPVIAATTPVALPEPVARPNPPPQAAAPSPPAPSQATTWQGQLLAHLARFRRYPPDALRRGFHGTALIHLATDRDGNVHAMALVRSSGHDMLDQEAQAWIARAEPLPKPPPEIIGDPIELIVPLAFEMR